MDEDKVVEEVVEDLDNPKEDDLIRIKLERYLWPEEQEIKNLKTTVKKQRYIIGLCFAIALLFGWLLGTFMPFSESVRQSIHGVQPLDTSNKIKSVMDVMQSDWFFAKDVEDLSERMTNHALKAITTNEEDPHTEYLTKEEVDAFTQNINRNFTGIGIQYYANNGMNLVEKVFKNSPAEKAGVKAGDIIYKIDGTLVDEADSETIKNMVQGEEGTVVHITFLREGQEVDIDITRAQIKATAFGQVIDDQIGYLEMFQFGDSTAEEVKQYLDDFKAQNVSKLIIDLRDNGGGYLNAYCDIIGYFVGKNQEVVKQEFADGSFTSSHSTKDKYDNFGPIVILTNEHTASASEIFTITMKELRDDVQIVGLKTYGKGTVQITRSFQDGSGLKYTTSKWLSPAGVNINGEGIEPDVEVKLHDILYGQYLDLEEGESFKVDAVSDYVKTAQLALDYLDYKIDRTDGYFSKGTEDIIKQYQKEHDIEQTGILDRTTYHGLISSVYFDWATTKNHDVQFNKAKEIVNGRS